MAHPSPTVPKKKLILAGAYWQARYYARSVGWTQHGWGYVEKPYDLYGRSNVEIHLVGDYWRSPAYSNLAEFCVPRLRITVRGPFDISGRPAQAAETHPQSR